MVDCEVGGFCINKTLKTFLPSFLLHCELLEERDYVLFLTVGQCLAESPAHMPTKILLINI